MTIALPDYKPADRDLLNWTRAVRTAFGEVDGTEVQLRYLAARAPIAVSLPLVRQPLDVYVRSAVNRTDRSVESGMRVTWRWTGSAVSILALDVSDTGDEYDVTIVVRT